MNQDFIDALRALSEADARYLVVGAFAVAVHAEPRATGDLDIWVQPTPENAARVWEALRRFGAPLADLAVEDLARPAVVFQMGVPPARIDVLTSISGVDFEEAWAARATFPLGDLVIPVVGRDDLIRNKRAVGRPKDLLDLELLAKHARRVE